MAIQEKTSANPAKANYNVSFNGKSNNPNPESPNRGSGLGYALPLAILMVTSPMNPVSAAEQYNRYVAAQEPTTVVVDSASAENKAVNPSDTYQLVPSTQEPQKKKSEQAFYIDKEVNNKYLSIVGVSTDSIKTSAEKMFLHYKDYNKNPGYEVKAKIFGYCPEPRDDGRLVAVFGLVGDTELSIAAFPPDYKPVFDRSVMIQARNNEAVKVFTMKEMIEIVGQKVIEKAPNIEEFVPTPEQQSKCMATGD